MSGAEQESGTLPCWCGSRDLRLCWRTGEFGLIRCAACGSYRIHPQPLTDPPACESFYNTYYEDRVLPAPPSAALRRSRFWRVAAQQPALVDPNKVAIDIGCGDGQLCAELARAGWGSVTGFDLSRPRIRQARRQYPELKFHDTPIGASAVRSGSADLLVMDNVIEHLPQPLDTIDELGTYLAPGGRLVIITPNMESGHYRLLGRRWTPELAPRAHIYLFTTASLRRLIDAAGMRIEATGTFHEPGVRARDLLARLTRGDVKGTVWRAVQDAGGTYGRLIGQGPMLYAIATAARHAAARETSEGPGERSSARSASLGGGH